MIGLVAVATFLIVAISSFRLQPTIRSTGGAAWFALSSVPVIFDLGTAAGRQELPGDTLAWPTDLQLFSWRLQPGQDASCNNLYQATQPQVLGVSDDWIKRFDDPRQIDLMWASYLPVPGPSTTNPWRWLLSDSGTEPPAESQPIPAVLDKNTAMYSLKIYQVGTEFSVEYDTGEKVTFRVVGFLENSLFQGSVLVGEADFRRAFPKISGYRYFLLAGGDTAEVAKVVDQLEDRLSDYGWDGRSSELQLKQFASVQNTYLNAFQALGGLGLLLGTLGLAAAQWRNLIERRQELALLQALGFAPRRIAGLLFWEQLIILLGGLGLGVIAALAATLPHAWLGRTSLPWGVTGALVSLIAVFGVAVLGWSVRQVLKFHITATVKG